MWAERGSVCGTASDGHRSIGWQAGRLIAMLPAVFAAEHGCCLWSSKRSWGHSAGETSRLVVR